MRIKCISINVWQGGNIFDALLDFIATEQPDILLLQEVYDSKDPLLERKYRTFEVLKQACGDLPYHDFAAAFVDNRAEGNIPQGNAVFSKFPITARDVRFFNEPYREDYVEVPENFPTCPRNLQHVTLETPAGELDVYNLQGVWDLDGDNDSLQRQRMSTVILEAVAGKPHVIVAGDTNAKPTNPAMLAIEARLTNVFKDAMTTSFNMRRKDNPGYATAVVDLMYVSPSIRIIERSCPDADISDHLPIIAVLEV
jgi:endonuclease/exonuclease/phosphatase family metal-dependent hydrolase